MQASTSLSPAVELRAVDHSPIDQERLVSRLRYLAFQRLDSEVFNTLQPHAETLQLTASDLYILAATLREASRLFAEHISRGKPDNDIANLVDFVSTVLRNSDLPNKPYNTGPFREYLASLIAWHETLRRTVYVERFWMIIAQLLRTDLSSLPDLRERILAALSEIGLSVELPEDLGSILLRFAAKPYAFSEARRFASVLTYGLHRRISNGDLTGILERWLPAWRLALASTRTSGKRERGEAIEIKTEAHRRIAKIFRMSGILLGRFGDFRVTLTLLVIKLDHLLFDGSKGRRKWIPWWRLRCLRLCFRKLESTRRRSHARRRWRPRLSFFGRRASAEPRARLRVIDDELVRGTGRDVLVTRVQGGLGDVMTMRPGLLELARRRRRGRVVFATNRAFFAAFSIDDALDLVDIERAEIDHGSFGRWVNLSDCPGARVEVRELPRIRSDRVKIFARSLGVRLGAFGGKTMRRIAFDASVDRIAEEFLRKNLSSEAPSIGIQLHAAEAYKEFPDMLELARSLAERYCVFVLDNARVPRRDTDRFIAVDNQPLQVAMAIAARLDLLVVLDSSFLHLAGANRIPCLALCGPTNGKVRVRPYRTVKYLDVRGKLACIPCWRNDFSKCHLANGYESICMKLLRVPEVVAAVDNVLAEARSARTDIMPLLPSTVRA